MIQPEVIRPEVIRPEMTQPEVITVFSLNKHLNSPYAKTSNWGIAELKRDIAEKKRQLAISMAKEVKEFFQIFFLKFFFRNFYSEIFF